MDVTNVTVRCSQEQDLENAACLVSLHTIMASKYCKYCTRCARLRCSAHLCQFWRIMFHVWVIKVAKVFEKLTKSLTFFSQKFPLKINVDPEKPP